MKTSQNSGKTAEKTSKPDPRGRDGAPVTDPHREEVMNGAHQGSTGQRDKHDR